MAFIYDLADTWNDAGTTFTAIKMNVTDTASNAASLLMDLQVGGVSKFSVAKGAGAIFGANLIEQRNGANAQTFNLYNTYTDASNYERGFMKWNSNVLEIGTEAAGTGSARLTQIKGLAIQFTVGAISSFQVQSSGNIIFNNSNSRDIGVVGGVARTVRVGTSIENDGYNQFKEMAGPPAGTANAVRIYAEDDGAGKTRLMAIFGTGAAQQIAIEP